MPVPIFWALILSHIIGLFEGAPPVRFIPNQPNYIQPVTNAGAIAVIGSTAASRRPADEDIQTIGTIGTETINTEIDMYVKKML